VYPLSLSLVSRTSIPDAEAHRSYSDVAASKPSSPTTRSKGEAVPPSGQTLNAPEPEQRVPSVDVAVGVSHPLLSTTPNISVCQSESLDETSSHLLESDTDSQGPWSTVKRRRARGSTKYKEQASTEGVPRELTKEQAAAVRDAET